VTVVSSFHTVQQGEHLSRIAFLYGFRDYQTIWNHPENAQLKAKRKTPNILLPGDKLFIPDKVPKVEVRPTGQSHRFQLAGQSLKLRIVLRDFDNQPIAGTACVLDVEGQSYDLQTDSEGLIEVDIPAGAENGTLRVPDLELAHAVKIGHLDPVDEDSGWQARLINLGYFAGSTGDDSADDLRLHYAIEQFQCDYKLKVTGELDDSTRSKLREVHGC
jgi:hypothetical protein